MRLVASVRTITSSFLVSIHLREQWTGLISCLLVIWGRHQVYSRITLSRAKELAQLDKTPLVILKNNLKDKRPQWAPSMRESPGQVSVIIGLLPSTVSEEIALVLLWLMEGSIAKAYHPSNKLNVTLSSGTSSPPQLIPTFLANKHHPTHNKRIQRNLTREESFRRAHMRTSTPWRIITIGTIIKDVGLGIIWVDLKLAPIQTSILICMWPNRPSETSLKGSLLICWRMGLMRKLARDLTKLPTA